MIKFPPSRIMVPMDFSKPSLTALEDAKILANKFGASLELVYIQSTPLSLAGFNMNGETAAVPALVKQMQAFSRWREGQMRSALRGFPSARAKVKSLQGWPPARIADLARGRGADLVVMGTHGYAGLDRAIFGSVAEAVVRRADKPVLTTHPKSRPLRFSKILVPYNMADYAGEALLYAAKWARSVGGRLTVLYVVPNHLWENDMKAVLKTHVQTVLGKADVKGIDLMVQRGDPRDEILKTAAYGRFDQIVLSAHRKPFWEDFTLGSTAERILRHSPAPVLAIPSVGAKLRRGTKSALPTWVENKIF